MGMTVMKRSQRIAWMLSGLLLAVLVASCALYRNDRAYLADDQYGIARQMYLQTGSLDLVQKRLVNMEWRRAKVNEAIYRLQKEFEVLPEELPALAQRPAPQTSATTSARPTIAP